MRKYLLIQLGDGSKYEVPIDEFAKGIAAGMFNKPAYGNLRGVADSLKKESYITLCVVPTAQCGFSDPNQKDRLVWIAPSRIKSIEVIFDTALELRQ